MATHSSVLPWRIPGTEEPGRLLSMGLHRVRQDSLWWFGMPISLRIFQFVALHTVKGFRVNKAEVDAFLELSCFFYEPTDVKQLISGSSAFFKSGLNIWTFTIHVLLKPGLENFEYCLASV